MKIKFNSIVALVITTLCFVSGKDSVVLAQSSRQPYPQSRLIVHPA
ncbi:hypothetical protein GM3708_3580 (plasmid) [Geminocystis sp. NIES-3708]|nr:hypothetical protein [Geminocystis sp. NIES-3708]BAQ63174.1 hypothetical protein GM3708_3580 [Geminocystis sp. NIES-3708]